MKKSIDISEIALLGSCDRMGRSDIDRKIEEENIKIIFINLLFSDLY